MIGGYSNCIDMTDGHLIAQIRAGDGNAAAELVDRYYDACWTYALRMTGDRADTEDVVQETFLRALRALDRYEERQRFQAWLFSILTNRCRTRLVQRRRAHRQVNVDGLSSYPDALVTEPVEAVDDDLSREALADALQDALRQLGPRYREAFLLKHAEGLEYTQMAEITGVSVSALKMRVKRAREILRPLLEKDRHA